MTAKYRLLISVGKHVLIRPCRTNVHAKFKAGQRKAQSLIPLDGCLRQVGSASNMCSLSDARVLRANSTDSGHFDRVLCVDGTEGCNQLQSARMSTGAYL